MCVFLCDRWQQPCSGWGRCLGCRTHLTCQLGRRMNPGTNWSQGQILWVCVCACTQGSICPFSSRCQCWWRLHAWLQYIHGTKCYRKNPSAHSQIWLSASMWRYVRSVCWASCRLKGGGGKGSVVQSNWYIANRVGFLSGFCGEGAKRFRKPDTLAHPLKR